MDKAVNDQRRGACKLRPLFLPPRCPCAAAAFSGHSIQKVHFLFQIYCVRCILIESLFSNILCKMCFFSVKSCARCICTYCVRCAKINNVRKIERAHSIRKSRREKEI